MSVKLPNGEISRSMPEQVGKNMRDIEELKTGYNKISNIAIIGGHLIVTLQDGTEFDAGAVKGLSSIAFNASRHLIVTYDDGTTADLGLIKGVSSMSINGSQHLIVTYDDGTTQDLGAIFSGNVNISGDLTANSIIENMIGYVAHKASSTASLSITYEYVGVVKTGNKITFVVAVSLIRHSNASPFQTAFTIPSAVGSKLYPVSIGGGNYLDIKQIKAWSDESTPVDIGGYFVKSSDTSIYLNFRGLNNLTLETKYYARYEATFLLKDNMVS